MCYEFDALPPSLPIAGGAIDTEDLVLTAADGNRFAAFVARAEGGSKVGMVVLPDVRGLFRFYEELAMRFAEAGINSLAIDYFGRTAGVSKRSADFDFWPEVRKTTIEGVTADTRAAVDYLRSPAGGSCTSIFTVGFCFGGSNSWLQAAAGHGLKGAIGFYGRPGDSPLNGAPGPQSRVKEFECPILGLFGGADQGIPVEQVQEFEAALKAANVPHEITIYDGAPHSFFDRAYEQFANESADAWTRMLAFVEKHR